MEFNDFEKVCHTMESTSSFECLGGRSEESIQKAEQDLEITFSKQCRYFYQKYDYTIIDSYELFGIQNGTPAAVLEGNCVAYALDERLEYGLPCDWIPLMNYGDGTMAYFDYSQLNRQGEPLVIRAHYTGSQFSVVEVLAEDLGGFLYQLLKSLED